MKNYLKGFSIAPIAVSYGFNNWLISPSVPYMENLTGDCGVDLYTDTFL